MPQDVPLEQALGLGGFNFDNARRNQMLAGKGVKMPTARKTGTTIVGVIYNVRPLPPSHLRDCSCPRVPTPPTRPAITCCDLARQGGVVLGADTRATEGDTVADKNCEKIHYIADNIWCCGAGTSADTESTTALISSQVAAPFTLPTPRPPLHTQFSPTRTLTRCASSHSSSCTG